MNARSVIIRPVISEKSYALLAANKYTFRVHDGANKTQVRQAIEEIFGVRVLGVRTQNVKPKPKRRGISVASAAAGRRPWSRCTPRTASSSSKDQGRASSHGHQEAQAH